jgi:hypothetical protein
MVSIAFGAAAADETIALPASALLDSNWPENVYQFVYKSEGEVNPTVPCNCRYIAN